VPARIFVNYRRQDASAQAARLHDRLIAREAFGKANVFMDVDRLRAGQRFEDELNRALAATDVFVSVIGSRWAELLAERQASGERDYVREEIATALARGIPVIPVLVDRAPLPARADLPADIRALVD
jgi:TIR domain